MSAVVKPLWSRPLDLFYVVFFVTHIFASLVIDLQALQVLPLNPRAVQWYIELSGDPLLGGMLEGKGSGELIWFKSFLWLELLFQVPTFFIAIKGLWAGGSLGIYVLLLVYGASTATTTLPCIVYLFGNADKVTGEQFIMLLSSYVPYFVIYMIITIDMAVYRLAGAVKPTGKEE